jgi:hypothetical protein
MLTETWGTASKDVVYASPRPDTTESCLCLLQGQTVAHGDTDGF